MGKYASDFREKLEDQHTWPGKYLFKFIIPKEKKERVQELFPGHELQVKKSKKGNYISLTIEIHMESSQEVIEIYEKAYEIDGVIAL